VKPDGAVARSPSMTRFAIPILALTFACHGAGSTPEVAPEGSTMKHVGTDPGHATATGGALTPTGNDKLAAFAAGCFWGVEDAFRHVPGVVATAPGYSGGHTVNPTYEDVCTHTTGHAETVLVEYDPAKVSYDKLLAAFWMMHDPTQVNRQGPDYGDNYRSVVFTFDDAQAQAARASKEKEQARLGKPIATSIEPMRVFYKAEAYHQQYSERTGDHSCPINLKLESL
jgi:peptide-methionine (S)-S-oxide reductase